MNFGKALILFMVVLGLGAGALGVWYRHHHENRVIDALTPQGAELLAFAPEVELIRLDRVLSDAEDRPAVDDETFEIQGGAYRAVAKQSLTESPTFTKLRKALVQNIAYDWEQTQPTGATDWPYLLRFRRKNEEALFAFDPAQCRIALPASQQVLSIRPVQPGLEKLLKEISPSAE